MRRIAIYIGTLPAQQELWQVNDWFNFEMVNRLLSLHIKDKYLLLSDEPVRNWFTDSKNVEYFTVGSYKPNVLSMYRHFNHKLPTVVKGINSQMLVSLSGILPLKVKGDSCLLLSDALTTIEKPVLKEGLARFQRRYLPKFLKNAGQIITLSEFSKQCLMSQYHLPGYRIHVVQRGSSTLFKELDWETREEVKEKYADGREFLLYVGDISKKSGVINLLKAFSVLKKKMQSSMVLVLAGRQDPAFRKFPGLLGTYHFRKDVKLIKTPSLSETALLMGGAYARVIPTGRVGFCSTVLETLQCYTPLVVPEGSVHEEAGGDAVLSFKPDNFNDMGTQLCELYKNEELRARLIVNAKIRVEKYSWDEAILSFLEAFRPAV